MTQTKYMLNGKEVTEQEFQSYRPSMIDGCKAKEGKGGWPRTSFSMGVHPDQVKVATEYARKAGVPTEFAANGQPIMTSQRHQDQYAKVVLNYVDLGDRTNTSRVEDFTR